MKIWAEGETVCGWDGLGVHVEISLRLLVVLEGSSQKAVDLQMGGMVSIIWLNNGIYVTSFSIGS